jgi:hypothetical protein
MLPATVALQPVVAQELRPEATGHYSRIARFAGLVRMNHPRLSADGRLLAFIAQADGPHHVYVVPRDGGERVQVTNGAFRDANPAWSERGDLIAFYSSRVNGVMIVAVDPATGRPTGAPRRVTTDSVHTDNGAFDLSPDGRSVAYLVRSPTGITLKIVPSNGGPAVTLAQLPGWTRFVRFDRDGRFVYFVRFAGPTEIDEKFVSRVPATGGNVEVVYRVPRGFLSANIDPIANRIIVRERDRPFGHVLSMAGDSVATVAWARGVGVVASVAFSRDGESLITMTDERSAALHVVPLDGGPSRRLTDGTVYEWPYAWIGNRIYYRTEESPSRLGWITPDGKQRGVVSFDVARIKPSPNATVSIDDHSSDARYFVLAVYDTGLVKTVQAYIHDTETRAVRLLTRDRWRVSFTVPGAGAGSAGSSAVLDGNVIVPIRRGSLLETHSIGFTGGDRVLHTVALVDTSGSMPIAIGRRMVAQVGGAGDRGETRRLYVSSGGQSPRQIAEWTNTLVWGLGFSPDERTLAVLLNVNEPGGWRLRVALVTIASDGSRGGTVRMVDVPDNTGDMRWSHDGQSLLYRRQQFAGAQSSIWRIPVAGSVAPQLVPLRIEGMYQGLRQSPDGREGVVALEENNRSSLWRIDLRKAAEERRR